MRTPYITASVIGLAIIAWLLSGQINKPEPPPNVALADQLQSNHANQQDRTPARVRVRTSEASLQTELIRVRGRTENKRTVVVRAETSGTLAARPVERGHHVNKGDLLCQLTVEDREAGLLEAQEGVNQARIEHEGAVKLRAKGFQSETAIAQTKARLAAAKAQLTRRQLDLDHTFIRAPFDGIVEDVHLELGDYVQPGADCVTLIDLDPMLLVGRASADAIARITLGGPASGKINGNRDVNGKISFLGQQADPATRTYAVEVEIPNSDYQLRSGLTADIFMAVAEKPAHKVSPALFALDDQGNMGIRTLSENHRVEFHTIEVIAEETDGVWVSGLPQHTILITVGQESVITGERVKAIYDAAQELPAAAPSSSAQPAEKNPSASEHAEKIARKTAGTIKSAPAQTHISASATVAALGLSI